MSILKTSRTLAAACPLTAGLLLSCALALSATGAWAADGPKLAHFDTVNAEAAAILKVAETTPVASVALDLDAPADVLVQFTSQISVEISEGCPCTVRALIAVDDQPPRVVRRVNVGAPTVQTVDNYDHDRSGVDGSTVFTLPAGRHKIALNFLQVSGTSKGLEVYYPNLQAIAFPKGAQVR